MSKLKAIKLLEFGEVITGKTPSSKYPEDFGTETPFITPSDSFNQKHISSTNRYLSSEGVSKLKNKVLPANSVMVTCIGSAMGKVAMTNSPSITNQQINSIKVNKNFDANYVYYCLKNNYQLLRNSAKGSTALPLLNKTEFEKLKFNVHIYKKDQEKISSVMSVIDSKIEINNQINTELEAMAKMLYDYWFVQFDFPDADGKPYKSSGGKMVYNETLKREIPEGWEVKVLADIATTGSGGTPLSSKNEYYANGDIPWINSGELNTSFIVSTNNFITKLGLEKSSAKLFKKNTILMAMYGATAGKVSFIDFPSTTNQAICGINPIDQHMNVYLKFNLERLYHYLVNLSSGSARDNLSQDKIRNLDIVIPNHYILSKFDSIVKGKMQLILNNIKQNQELERLRDWLLPMLMNGQVTVSQ